MAIVQSQMVHDSSNPKFLSRCPRLQPSINTVEAIEQALEGAVTTPFNKISFNQQQMKKIAESLRMDQKDRLHRFFEHLQHVLIKRQSRKQERVNGRGRKWRPALQSIPEEI